MKDTEMQQINNTAENKDVHRNHRERMRSRLHRFGAEAMEEHEILEVLLYTTIKRENTNPIAHRLIDRFGSLRGVLEADCEDLLKVNGVGVQSAQLINTQLDFFRAYLNSGLDLSNMKLTGDNVGEYVTNRFMHLTEERVQMICLTADGYILADEKVCGGGISSANFDIRNIVEKALKHNTRIVLLAHNHPSGNIEPSALDCVTTEVLRAMFGILGIRLWDHLIVSGKKYNSVFQWIKDFGKQESLPSRSEK